MQATRKLLLRGMGPVGPMSPSGVITWMTSPTQARSAWDISLPTQIPGIFCRVSGGIPLANSSGCASLRSKVSCKY